MPNRPKRPCRQPGCPELVDSGFCDKHQNHRRALDRRTSSTQRGYDADWQRVRIEALRRDKYLCQHCLREGRVTPAEDVDHIVPLSRGGARLDHGNLQSLCRPCHNVKTAKDNTTLY